MEKDGLYQKLRTLAKSNYYQTLYSQSKEINLRIFKNDTDLSQLQILFLQLLGFYSHLYLDLALGEVDERIFQNETYEDAYNYYKRKHKPDKKDNPFGASAPKTINKSSWIFKTPPKGEKLNGRH